MGDAEAIERAGRPPATLQCAAARHNINYDGSKPPTRLEVECWFEHDPTLARSMA